ncbi:unnamed protein product [Paramecium octaurelia]|uniref:Uncharacterized protein n=1 Tax=Paramecium octaurelia TaxID=43137 RepID=A0A8S1Y574_PAROT|nr:unnamed protein product [Paramecium octaurelia]
MDKYCKTHQNIMVKLNRISIYTLNIQHSIDLMDMEDKYYQLVFQSPVQRRHEGQHTISQVIQQMFRIETEPLSFVLEIPNQKSP